MSYTQLRRVYLFSDTYGRSKNPFLQDDADALLSTDFRSFPLEQIHREFDIYGREAITGHVLRLIFDLHEQCMTSGYLSQSVREEYAKTTTGIFINAAPRLNKQNGSPFYVAEAPGIRIVTTNPAGLSSIKHKLTSLKHLNNDQNPIYSGTEQFRSSFTAFLLHEDHGIDLIEDDLQIIPDVSSSLWELSYVDRFGNIMTYTKDVEARWKSLEDAAENGMVKLIIGNVSQNLYLGSSLKDAEPGSMVVYKNKDIDILRKWMPGEDSYTLLYRSAFMQFSKPEIGANIRIAD